MLTLYLTNVAIGRLLVYSNMGLKKNIIYSSFLTLSNYVFGLITFPYIARVLGVSNMGTIDFATNIIAYFLIFSSLGIGTLGIREVAKLKDNKEELNKCFSGLLLINILYTIVTLLVFFVLIFTVDRFVEQKVLLLIGSVQVLSTTFLIEWLFRGLEDFQYITLRNIAIKIVYVIVVFVLIKESDDYVLYFFLTVCFVLINAIVNIVYSRKFVRFRFKDLSFKPYIKNTVYLGMYSLLTSMYTTFNVVFLGFASDSIQVGYYTTALKLYSIVMGFYTAFTSVMMPRSSSLLMEGNRVEFDRLIAKSFELLYTLCFPLIIFCMFLAPQLIELLAGSEFAGAIVPMRIVMPLLFVVGVAQILALQVLIPIRKDTWTLCASVLGAIIGITLNILLATKFWAIGTSITLVLTEFSVTGLYVFIIWKNKLIKCDLKMLWKHFIYSIPYVIICFLYFRIEDSPWKMLLQCAGICGLYFCVSQIYFIKNSLILNFINSKSGK